MPTYVYGCDDREHGRAEVVHGMAENPVLWCEVCGEPLHRIPQPLLAVAFNPTEVLTSWMSENYKRVRGGQARFSPDTPVRPDKPIGGRLAHLRRRKIDPQITQISQIGAGTPAPEKEKGNG